MKSTEEGLFITFEGSDGCGKSTQAKLFARILKEANISHILTCEPGGTPVGAQIRAIFIDQANTLLPLTEALLMVGGRHEHVERVIKPGLEAGKVVVSDRHRDSSAAYQGGGRQLSLDLVEQLNNLACGDILPDATVLLVVPVEESVRRARGVLQDTNLDGRGDRIEQEALEFHQRVYDTYQKLIELNPGRFIVVDGTQSIEEVTRAICSALAERFPDKLINLLSH